MAYLDRRKNRDSSPRSYSTRKRYRGDEAQQIDKPGIHIAVAFFVEVITMQFRNFMLREMRSRMDSENEQHMRKAI